MEIKGVGIAGTMESSDILITLRPGENAGICVDLNSVVEKEFGREIRGVILAALEELGVCSAHVTAVDKGALNCTIRARVKAAAFRAGGGAAEGGRL